MEKAKKDTGTTRNSLFKRPIFLMHLNSFIRTISLIGEFDWSSGHSSHKVDGLHPANMNVQYGGKQKVVHDSIVTEDCLGSELAVMKFNGTVLDKKLKLGDKQSMVFLPGDPPPFYFLDCPTHDQVSNKKPKKKLTKSALKKREEHFS
eukprot:Pompholyxophrys_punicea_v1_NODE_71_length_3757_cov_5.265460.p4 type:complete len:148 gc:universal NODE_71_length_3757_cov_5.265460:1860-2303(+)